MFCALSDVKGIDIFMDEEFLIQKFVFEGLKIIITALIN